MKKAKSGLGKRRRSLKPSLFLPGLSCSPYMPSTSMSKTYLSHMTERPSNIGNTSFNPVLTTFSNWVRIHQSEARPPFRVAESPLCMNLRLCDTWRNPTFEGSQATAGIVPASNDTECATPQPQPSRALPRGGEFESTSRCHRLRKKPLGARGETS